MNSEALHSSCRTATPERRMACDDRDISFSEKNENAGSAIIRYIDIARETGASDLHLKAAAKPAIRVAGEVVFLDEPVMNDEEILSFLRDYTSVDTERLISDAQALDFAVTLEGVRLRGNAYKDYRGINVAFRLLTIANQDFETLGIPEILKSIAMKRSGLVLITGPTGSGKTTTLTCVIEYINALKHAHIIMLEDPIEFIHSNDKCIISQREIGKDTPSFGDAITEAMREDPDIIMVGEMRDRESIETALRAAETGHLVFSTLHTKGAVNSMTQTMAKELARYGIRVNAVAPGFVMTEMVDQLPEDKKKEYLKAVPMGRFADVSEVADLVSFLCSDESKYITGQSIVLDGGLSL